MTIYAQGDVLLRRVQELPTAATPLPLDRGHVVLAYGEVTGHAHAIDGKLARLFGLGDGRRFVALDADADLVHGSIALEHAEAPDVR